MAAPHHGGCICGAIRYVLDAEPLTLYACHCTNCQTWTGTSFALSMIVLAEALTLEHGDPSAYELTLPDGLVKRGKRCDACGVRLWGEPVKFPGVAVVQPGTLDDTTWLRPIGHIWTRSAQPWVSVPPGPFTFDEQPADPLTLIQAYQDRAQTSVR